MLLNFSKTPKNTNFSEYKKNRENSEKNTASGNENSNNDVQNIVIGVFYPSKYIIVQVKLLQAFKN
jgi:hypothetical protein